MIRSRWLPAVAVALCLSWSASVTPAQEVRPGEPIEYQPFYPDKWKQFNQSTKVHPWEGKRVVMLTTTTDLDGKTMAVFLKQLDAGWSLYEDLIGRKPAPFKQHNGKVTIAAVPAARFTCGMGCGHLGSTGIEVGGFYKNFFDGPGDYDLVRKDPEVFSHYYFYEMGRNYFVFGDRHNAFTTGFAVFMRNVCMDTLRCKDPDKATREKIERAEALYAESGVTFTEAFIESKGIKDKSGKPIHLTDANVMYASVMLKLRKDHGGDEWVKRFYHHMLDCPRSPGNEPDGHNGQVLNWVVAASLAGGQDLSPRFLDRWRFPVSPELSQALQKVDWPRKGLTVGAVYDSLPVDHLPTSIAVRNPDYLTAERRKGNLIVGGTFEEGSGGEWSARADEASVTGDVAKDGKRSLAIRSPKDRDASYVQKVKVVPNTRYLLSGWVKTKDVEIVQTGGIIGANLSVYDGWDRSESIVGDTDWTYLVLVFDSGKRTEVEVCTRLGFFGSTAKGTAWFDDICLVKLGNTPPGK